MKILLLNHYAGSPEMGMEFRPYYLAREWVKMGHQVRIMAANFSHLRRKNPSVHKDFQTQMIDGIEYCWLKTRTYEGNGVKRALTMFQFVGKLILHARRIVRDFKPDVVIASSTYPMDTFAAQLISRIAKAKYIHEVHDLWPATLYEVGGMSRKNPFVVLMQISENSAYQHCDQVVSLMPYAKDYMMEHGLKAEKFNNIQNGVVEEEWAESDPIPEEHAELLRSLKDKFIVGYFGGHALSNALDLMLDTAKAEKDPDVAFVLVGNGVEKENLMERAKKEKLQNVYFLPPVKKTAVPDLVSHFDCSYMGGIPSPLYRFGLCLNKMYDSMMAGKPVICAMTAPKTLVEEYECGYKIDPEINLILDSIAKLKAMPAEERDQLGQNGKKAVEEHFTYRKLAEQFVRVMEE